MHKGIQLVFDLLVIRNFITIIIRVRHIRVAVTIGVCSQCPCGDDVIHAADQFIIDELLGTEPILFGGSGYRHRFERIGSHGDRLHFIRFHGDAEEFGRCSRQLNFCSVENPDVLSSAARVCPSLEKVLQINDDSCAVVIEQTVLVLEHDVNIHRLIFRVAHVYVEFVRDLVQQTHHIEVSPSDVVVVASIRHGPVAFEDGHWIIIIQQTDIEAIVARFGNFAFVPADHHVFTGIRLKVVNCCRSDL